MTYDVNNNFQVLTKLEEVVMMLQQKGAEHMQSPAKLFRYRSS